MFEPLEEDLTPKLGSGSDPETKKRKAPFNWGALPVTTLIRYHDEIRQFLPPLELSRLNLEQELLLQFHTARALQTEILADADNETNEIPANQKAQIVNSVASILNKLAELQSAAYTTERYKQMENLLIHTLRELPEEQAAKFIDRWEEKLKALT